MTRDDLVEALFDWQAHHNNPKMVACKSRHQGSLYMLTGTTVFLRPEMDADADVPENGVAAYSDDLNKPPLVTVSQFAPEVALGSQAAELCNRIDWANVHEMLVMPVNIPPAAKGGEMWYLKPQGADNKFDVVEHDTDAGLSEGYGLASFWLPDFSSMIKEYGFDVQSLNPVFMSCRLTSSLCLMLRGETAQMYMLLPPYMAGVTRLTIRRYAC